MELFIHLGKSVGVLLIFYVVYVFALRKTTFFTTKRHFLIAGIISSIGLPFLEFTKIVTIILPPQPITTIDEQFIPLDAHTIAQVPSAFIPDWWLVVAVFYSVGALILIMWLGQQLFFLSRLLQSGSRSRENGYTFVQVNSEVSPFSFFTYIVYNPKLHTQSELEMILVHEQIHARQWHSLDMLLMHLGLALHWCNPIAWMYKKSIEENLEFIADSEAVNVTHCKQTYQRTLVRVSSTQSHPALTNPFYKSFIKKRIVMLNTPQSRKHHLWKLGLVLPLLALFMYSFNIKEIEKYVTEENAFAKASLGSISDEEIALDNINTEKDFFLINQESTSITLDNLERYVSDHWQHVKIKFNHRIFTPSGKLFGFHFQTKFNDDERFVNRFTFENEITKDWKGYRFMVINEKEILVVEEGDGSLFKITPDKLMINHSPLQLDTQPLINDDVSPQKEQVERKPIIVVNGQVIMPDQTGKKYSADSITTVSPAKAILKYGSAAKDGALLLHTGSAQNMDNKTSTFVSAQETYRYKITKNTTIEELKKIKKVLKEKYGVTFKYRNIDFNAKFEITSVRLDLKDATGNNINYTVSGSNPIPDLIIYRDVHGNSGMGAAASQEGYTKLRIREGRENDMEFQQKMLKIAGKARREHSIARRDSMRAHVITRRNTNRSSLLYERDSLRVPHFLRKDSLRKEIFERRDSLRFGLRARHDSLRNTLLVRRDSIRGTARLALDHKSRHLAVRKKRKALLDEERQLRKVKLQQRLESVQINTKLREIQRGNDAGSLTLKNGKTYYFVIKDDHTKFYNHLGEQLLENDQTHNKLREMLRGQER